MNLHVLVSHCLEGMNSSGRYRMRRSYQSVLNSVSGFCSGKSVSVSTVYTKSFLLHYEEYLLLNGCKRNTCSYYMGVLRSLYTEAVSRKAAAFTPGLFSEVFTGSDPTPKRAVLPEVIARLYSADLSAVSRLDRCRDFFMLSFHLQGMSFIDLAYLRKNEVEGEVINYRRHKTGGLVTITLLPAARELFDKYADEVADSPYMLPLITLPGLAGRTQYETALRRQNRQLKDLSTYLGIQETLTSYTARHSWATIAFHNNVSVSMVSQAMGHHTEEITRVYLDSFANEQLRKANQKVFDAILKPIEEGRVEPFVNLNEQQADEVKTNSKYPKTSFETKAQNDKSVPTGLNVKNVNEENSLSRNVRLLRQGGQSRCKLT